MHFSKNELNRPKAIVALVAGAGAVKNGWEPVIKAVSYYTRAPGNNLLPDSANLILARFVHNMRMITCHHTKDFPPPDFDVKKNFSKLKKSIAQEILQAEYNNEIQARDDLKTLFDQFVLPVSRTFSCFTTNWDTTLWKFIYKSDNFHPPLQPLSDVGVLHLHGAADDSEKLYLPSESSIEPYLSNDEFSERISRHIYTVELLSEARRIILYGLSLSPLDSELGEVVSEAVAIGDCEQILIIDPNHEQIAKRLYVILHDPRKVQILGIPPENFTKYNLPVAK